jgi:hypothetical protein
MSIIVRDDGFHPDDATGEVRDVASDTGLGGLPANFDGIALIRVAFPSFSDGRGFTLVEISDEQAARQTEAQWLRRADWRAHDYRTRVRA